MGENILIFRSAKHYIVENLIADLKRKGNPTIYLVVQDESKARYQKMKGVNLIIYPDGYFNYQNLLCYDEVKNNLLEIPCQKIYVPYSTTKPKVEEVEKIIANLLGRKVIYLYDKFGNIKKHQINMLIYNLLRVREKMKNYFVDFCLHFIGIWYMKGLK